MPSPPKLPSTARAVLGAAALLAGLAWSPAARADEGSYRTYAVMLGPNVGGSFHKSPGLLVGGELSFVHFNDGVWFGLYSDVLYDQGLSRTRFSIGPEVGLGPFGVDFGFVRELGADPRQGWRVRGLLSAVFITAYAGPGLIRAGDQKVDFWEAGLLFKTPIKQF